MSLIRRILRVLRAPRDFYEPTTAYGILEELRQTEAPQSRRPGDLGQRMAERTKQYLG